MQVPDNSGRAPAAASAIAGARNSPPAKHEGEIHTDPSHRQGQLHLKTQRKAKKVHLQGRGGVRIQSKRFKYSQTT